MGRYLVQRLIRSIVSLVGVVTVVFILARLSGDPVALLMPPFATRQEIEAMRHALGLDQSLAVQYLVFLQNVLRGDFGMSLYQREPALALVMEYLPATLQLAAAAFAVAVAVAVPLGILAALKPRRIEDGLAMTFALFGQSAPTFWVGIMLILIFASTLGWLPTSGYGKPSNLVLPTITLALFPMASIARLMRSAMLDVISKDYIRTAQAKGLRALAVLWGHALKNAAIPVVTIMGLQFGTLLAGAVVTETVFAWPGVGRLAVTSISNRDYPVLQATVAVAATMFVAINFLVDLTYSLLDPRIKYA